MLKVMPLDMEQKRDVRDCSNFGIKQEPFSIN